jgi:Vitamin K-dependent gamma-carboxylase
VTQPTGSPRISRLQRVRSQALDVWERFWHEPVRAERMALMRICVGLALLSDQLLQYLPFWGYLFGPNGTGSFALNEGWMVNNWRWPSLFFTSESQSVLVAWFVAWVLSAVALVLGYKTRVAAVLAWVLTMAFFTRNTNVKNGGDDVAQIGLFWLMFAPCNRVWALDAKRVTREWIAPWAVRLIQIQICIMYTATGIAKLKGGLGGTWLQGTSLHYVFNDLALTRWSYAQLPVPFWVTSPLTYVALFWEVLFIPLVLHPSTRRFALYYGLLFHVVIYMTLEVGWFSFYSMALYPVWIADGWFVQRWPVYKTRGLRWLGDRGWPLLSNPR